MLFHFFGMYSEELAFPNVHISSAFLQFLFFYKFEQNNWNRAIIATKFSWWCSGSALDS